jgi:spermidine synthase
MCLSCAAPSRSALLLAMAIGLAVSLRSASAQTETAPLPDGSSVVRESVYNYLKIERVGSVIKFRRLENGAAVSAIDLADPRRQIIPYTATMFAAALVNPNPAHVLNIGLGAGAFDRLFESGFKDAALTTVEIDPMMFDVAKVYTGFQPDDRDKIVINDGRRYLRLSEAKWDWIVLDAYVRRSQVPPQFTTVEFYQLVASRLNDYGVFVDNLHAGTELYQSTVKTLAAVFPQVVYFTVPPSGNVIAVAVTYKTPRLDQQILSQDLSRLPALSAWNVDYAAIRGNLVMPEHIDVPRGVKILTDDFAPAEYLEAQPAR